MPRRHRYRSHHDGHRSPRHLLKRRLHRSPPFHRMRSRARRRPHLRLLSSRRHRHRLGRIFVGMRQCRYRLERPRRRTRSRRLRRRRRIRHRSLRRQDHRRHHRRNRRRTCPRRLRRPSAWPRNREAWLLQFRHCRCRGRPLRYPSRVRREARGLRRRGLIRRLPRSVPSPSLPPLRPTRLPPRLPRRGAGSLRYPPYRFLLRIRLRLPVRLRERRPVS